MPIWWRLVGPALYVSALLTPAFAGIARELGPYSHFGFEAVAIAALFAISGWGRAGIANSCSRAPGGECGRSCRDARCARRASGAVPTRACTTCMARVGDSWSLRARAPRERLRRRRIRSVGGWVCFDCYRAIAHVPRRRRVVHSGAAAELAIAPDAAQRRSSGSSQVDRAAPVNLIVRRLGVTKWL